MKMKSRKISPTAKPEVLANDLARSMATMIQTMMFTIGMK